MKHQRPHMRESALHLIPVAIAIGAVAALVWTAHGVEDPDGLELGAQQTADGQAWERERLAEDRRRALIEAAKESGQ